MTSLVSVLAASFLFTTLAAQTPGVSAGTTLDETLPPGANFDKAEFRFWLPSGAKTVRALVVLVPGSNGDGRPMAADAFWQEFATKQQLALVACRFTDKPHDQSFIEDYVNVSRGSGQALLEVIGKFAERSGHAEIARAPLLLWGMSAGGQFNYEFVAWKPERVAAFIVNKGGIYYSALLSKAARDVPGFLFVGERDLQSRVDTITGLFAVNRRGGAVWALVVEPGAGHVVGQSRDLGALLFEEALTLRLSTEPTALASLAGKPGFVGDLNAGTFEPAATPGTPAAPNAWLPTERLAKAWQAAVGKK
jgi:poly(3-hydroxybutyrate) depolymerase